MADDPRRENLRKLVFELGFDDEGDQNDPGLTELYSLACSDKPVARYACVMVQPESEGLRTAALVDRLDDADELFVRSYPPVVPQTVIDLDSGEEAADVEWEEVLRVSIQAK